MSERAPLLSVLCLTYNHAPFVAETLESFLAQQVAFEIEVIVADDCSTDGTVDVVESFRDRLGERLRLLRTDVNLGVTRNFRRALAACRGRYVALCEGDDYWRGTEKLQRQVDYLEGHPECVLAFHDATMLAPPPDAGVNPMPPRLRRDASRHELQATRPISTLTVCFRNVLKEVPPELDQAPVLDLCLWSLLGRHGEGRYMAEIEPAAYRVHAAGVFSMQAERSRYLMTAQSLLALARVHARLGDPVLSDKLVLKALLLAARWLGAGSIAALTALATPWWLIQRLAQAWRGARRP